MLNLNNPLIILGIILFLFYLLYLAKILRKISNHNKKYRDLFIDYFNPNKDIIEIKNYILNWEESFSQDLKLLFGEKRNDNIIKEIILKDLRKENSLFLTLVNISPAIGLLFTFLGLFFTLLSLDIRVFDDLISLEIFSSILSALSHLAPVFLFGFLGIAIYALGLWRFNFIEKKQEHIANELNLIYHKFEEKYFPSKIIDLDEAYHKLLKPLNETLNSLRQINTNFTSLGEQIIKYVDVIDNNSKNLINTFNEITIEILGNFEKKSQQIIENISLKIDTFAQNIDSFTTSVSVTYQNFANQSEKLIPAFESNLEKLNKLQGVLADYVSNISSLSERMRDLDVVVENLVKFNKYFTEIQEKIDKNITALTKNSELIRHSLVDSGNISKSISEINKQVYKQLEKSEVILRALDKYDMEKLINKLIELEKNNLNEMLRAIRTGEFIKINPPTSENGSDKKLNEILQEIKKSNEIFIEISQVLKNNGKSKSSFWKIFKKKR